MSTLARNEKREQLRYNYTPVEREEKGRQLADALNRQSIEDANLDRIKADFKARLATIEEEVQSFKNSVLSGYELREYVCFWEYDVPGKGRKTLRRKEPPCDIVREEEMTEADRQTVIESIERQMTEQDGPGTTLVVLPGAALKPVNQPPAGASEDDELAWAKALEEQRKQTAKESAEKAKAAKGKGRRTSSGGVVGTEADGKDLTTEDDKKNGY